MSFLLRPVRFLAQALTAQGTPKQLAMGFAMGMAVGLVPKGNLTAILMMTVMCASRVNLAAGMLSAFAFSWIGMLLDPVAHEVGLWVLSIEFLHPAYTWMYNAPVVPWTAFNNTVVMGSFVVGLTLLYPTYRATLPLFARYKPLVEEKLRKKKAVRWLLGAEYAGKLS